MNISLNKTDRAIWESELSSFVPDRVFDFHCHIRNGKNMNSGVSFGTLEMFPFLGVSNYERYNGRLFPGREMNYLVTGWPHRGSDLEKQNEFVFRQSRKKSGCRILLLVCPEMTPDYIIKQLDKTKAAGFKPYKCFSASNPEDSPITAYLPEEQLEIANSYKLIATLHLSRKKGIADKTNFKELLQLSDKYPEITWNMAHCGRSFIPEYLEADMPKFAELKKKKVYFDVSAVTDSEVMYLLITGMGPSRILCGSDNPVGLLRGKCAGLGYDWMFLTEDKFNFKELKESFGNIQPTFTLYEQLRALRRACRRAKLSKKDVAGIFYDNAYKLLSSG